MLPWGVGRGRRLKPPRGRLIVALNRSPVSVIGLDIGRSMGHIGLIGLIGLDRRSLVSMGWS